MGGGAQTLTPAPTTLHANAVAVNGRGVLIEGPSGAGKSSLSLAMMALGAVLVADDRVIVSRRGQEVIATAPPTISGQIEARGIGILRAEIPTEAPICAILDLSTVETERLPPHRSKNLLGITLPLLHYVESPHFAAGLMQYLRYGRAA